MTGAAVGKWRVVAAAAAVLLVAVAGTSLALAGNDSIRDPKADTKALKRKPEIDIIRVSAADEAGRRVKFKMTMAAKLTPKNTNTRPFILINTKGGRASGFEYLVLGPRVFKVVGDDKYDKVGANKFLAKKSTWIYRFKPGSIGLHNGDSFGWAVLTAKGKTADLAPDDRYRDFKIETIPKP
jgi:hypothetical protein